MADEAHQEKPISLFYSYSHRDEALRGELEAHLSFLRRSKLISEWHDRMIGAGDEWKGQIDRQLEVSDIILLLISADFIASDYCWGEEMTKALARHQLGEARVIPVILRPCQWQRTRLGSLQAVPKDGNPVSEWPNHDAAFNEIAAAIKRTIDDVQKQRRRAGEKDQRQRQPTERQKRDAQQRGEQDEGRRAPEVLVRHPPSGHSGIKNFAVFCDIDAPWCPEMVVLPAGEFMMGSPDSDERKSRNERYQHLVTIARPFAIGLYPVMFREYDHFCKCTNRQKPPDSDFGRDRRPVIHVSWLEARAYVRWLSDVTGQAYRLPSEAEWEYACRAGTTTRYSVGDEITAKSANYSSKVSRTTEVGAYAPNPWGVFDMHGNVWEWVEDIWHDSYGYGDAPADGSAWNDGERENSPLHRVTRGGSWITRATFLRSAHRSGMAPHESTPDCGFRVARTLD